MPRRSASPALLTAPIRAAALVFVGALAAAAQDPPAVDLHWAALQGDVDAIRAHVAAGSELDRVDAYGSTPLLVATTFGHAAAVDVLAEGGADLTLANAEGSMPLHVAAFLGHDDVAEVLLRSGADPHVRNDDGALPFDLAAVPVEYDRALLDELRAGLGPLGLDLDEDGVARGRAEIVKRLRRPAAELAGVDPRPEPRGGWPTSTPASRGLDPDAVARLYADAADLEAIRSVLIVKDGHLVAEQYFNGASAQEPFLVQSVTKSVTSALVGIALDRGCLESLDEPMLDFFPEEARRVRDERKREITVRQMLQMRAGYGWEGSDSTRWEGLISGDYLPLLVDFPLQTDPGAAFDYSNVTSHLLAVVVARACHTDLKTLADEALFSPTGMHPGDWRVDRYGYRFGHGELHLTARDMARFGLLYLHGGVWDGRPVVPAEWVDASLTAYSRDMDTAGLRSGTVGRYFRDAGYGYQWWSARVGERRFDFAWGHGGQMIVLLHDLDMVIVVTSDPFYRPIREDHEAWTHEQANFNLIGKFLQSLEGVL